MSFFNGLKTANQAAAKVATLDGWLFPVFIMATAAVVSAAASPAVAAVMAGQTVTNGGVLTSFWSAAVTDPITREIGLTSFANNMFAGAKAFGSSAYEVAGAGINAGLNDGSIWESIVNAWHDPISAYT